MTQSTAPSRTAPFAYLVPTTAVRRTLYAVLFEGIGVLLSTIGLLIFSHDDGMTTGLAVLGSVIMMTVALLYNFAFNALFEAWESRQTTRGRSLLRRISHACLFEAGLMVILVPFLAWWMSLGLIEALVYDIGMTTLFALYALVFTWVFDGLFGLPASAS